MNFKKILIILTLVYVAIFSFKYLIIDTVISASLLTIPIFLTYFFPKSKNLQYWCAGVSSLLLLIGSILFLNPYASYDIIAFNNGMMILLFWAIAFLINTLIRKQEAERMLIYSKAETERVNRKLQLILSNAEQYICGIDYDYNFILFNDLYQKEFLKVFGSKIEVGDNILEMIVNDVDKDTMKSFLTRAFNGEKFNVIHKYDSCNRFYYQVSFNPIKNLDIVTGVVIIIKNISEELENKRKIETQQTQLSLSEQFSHVGHWRYVIDSQWVQWSDQIYNVYGKPMTDQVVFSDMYEMAYDGDKHLLKNYINNSLKTGEPFKTEFRIMINGDIRYLVIECYSEKTEDGKLISLYGVLQDITTIKKTLIELSLSEERYKSMISSLSEGIVFYGMDGRILSCNEQIENLIGMTLDEMKEARDNNGFVIYREDGSLMPKEELPSMKTLRTGQPCNNVILGIKTKKDIVWTSCNSRLITWDGDDEDSFAVTVTFSDVSERIKIEKALNVRAEELAQSNHDLERFAYVVSHDLQEPLRTITNYCQLLQKRYSDKIDEDGQLFIKYTIDSAKRMKELLNALLELSRVTSKAKAPKLVYSKLILDDILDDLDALIKDTNATINVTDKLQNVYMYDVHFKQILSNLITNSLKFRNNNTDPIINIGTKIVNDNVIFYVSDNGIGIEENQFDRIFEIFTKLHNREQYPGAGIGLAICKKIIDYYGGEIWVESKVGSGTTFTFTLPISKRGKSFNNER